MELIITAAMVIAVFLFFFHVWFSCWLEQLDIRFRLHGREEVLAPDVFYFFGFIALVIYILSHF